MIVGVYATMEEVKEYLQGEGAIIPSKDDARLRKFCVQMSRKFDAECKRRFFPLKGTRYFDLPDLTKRRSVGPVGGPYPNLSLYHDLDASRCLRVDDDLLSVLELTTDNDQTTITADQYLLMTGQSHNYPPYDRIQLKDDQSASFGFSITPQRANKVVGLWGYHVQYDDAWLRVEQITAAIDETVTTIPIQDHSAADVLGNVPRLQEQHLLRFGGNVDAEFAYLTGKSGTDNNQITVIRGVNGTMAQSQAQNTDIYVYQPMDEIKHAMLVLSTHAYRRKDSVGTDDDRALASSTGVVLLPSKLPSEVVEMLDVYRRSSMSLGGY